MPARLSYLFQPGDARRYAVTATVSGHVPSFKDPFNLAAKLEYLVTAKKRGEKGILVEFSVASGSVLLADKTVPADGTPTPGTTVLSIMPLQEMRRTLNTWAELGADGAVLDVQGGRSEPPFVNVGFDLRKLFLVTMPVIFPNTPIQPGDTWHMDDGILGSKLNQASYENRLLSVDTLAKEQAFHIQQEAGSVVDDTLDSKGQHTDDPAAIAGSLKGTLTLNSEITFVSSTTTGDTRNGRISAVHSMLTSMLRRMVPDPNEPAKKMNQEIRVKINIRVKAL